MSLKSPKAVRSWFFTISSSILYRRDLYGSLSLQVGISVLRNEAKTNTGLYQHVQNILEGIVSARIRGGFDYWMSKRAGRRMPSRGDITPAEIVELLPYIILIDVTRDPLDFRYRLIGTVIDTHMNQPLTGRWISSIPHQRAPSRIWTACERVLVERTAHSSDIPYIGPMKDFVVSEDILMPLSDDGETVDMIFVVVDYLREADLPPKSD